MRLELVHALFPGVGVRDVAEFSRGVVMSSDVVWISWLMLSSCLMSS
jgi:hypothetical protein